MTTGDSHFGGVDFGERLVGLGVQDFDRRTAARHARHWHRLADGRDEALPDGWLR